MSHSREERKEEWRCGKKWRKKKTHQEKKETGRKKCQRMAPRSEKKKRKRPDFVPMDTGDETFGGMAHFLRKGLSVHLFLRLVFSLPRSRSLHFCCPVFPLCNQQCCLNTQHKPTCSSRVCVCVYFFFFSNRGFFFKCINRQSWENN